MITLVFINVPDLRRGAVGGHIGRSDSLHICAVFDDSARVPNFDLFRKVVLKLRVHWNVV